MYEVEVTDGGWRRLLEEFGQNSHALRSRQHWLLEWEKAQRELKQHDDEQASPGKLDSASRAALIPTAQGNAARVEFEGAPAEDVIHSSAPVPARTEDGTAAKLATRFGLRNPATVTEPRAGQLAELPVTAGRRDPPVRQAQPHEPVSNAARNAGETPEQQSFRVFLHEGKLHLVVRDPELGMEQLRRIVPRWRAAVEAHDLPLARIVVNGRVFWNEDDGSARGNGEDLLIDRIY